MPYTPKPTLDFSKLHASLADKAHSSERYLRKHHPQAVALLESAGVQPGKIREHAAKLLTSGALASALVLGAPIIQSALPTITGNRLASLTTSQLQQAFIDQLHSFLPQTVEPLTKEQEHNISKVIRQIWGIKAKTELDGNRLNQSYGYIGAEQHLPRFPGDSLDQHDEYLQEGITPGLGAWGYFAPSRNQLTNDLIQKEKYYVAVQTLYLPDWEKRLPYLRDWYKYRKVLVVNPVNGKTIVADVADSGPANWTGKHFGGSPEVMAFLGLNVGPQKGAVLLFFVDDPENQIPLGPVEYNVQRGPPLVANK